MSTYVVADIHGQLNTFLAGLKAVEFSPEDYLYVLGDAIDRGPDGIKVLQKIMTEPNMDLIIGNHEFMMINSVDPNGKDELNGKDWHLWLFYNGGDKTFSQYETLKKAERKELLKWLNDRYVIRTIEVKDRRICLSHSYYKKGFENLKYKEMNYKDVWNIVWTSIYRDDYETHGEYIYGDYDYTFVTGHVPVQRIRKWIEVEDDFGCLKSFKKGNLIDIDGGCSFGEIEEVDNGLIFLRLEDMEEFPVSFIS
jgi:serine/threonine protein phosphatase 1